MRYYLAMTNNWVTNSRQIASLLKETDISPAWQRDFVWTPKKEAKFIVSILQGKPTTVMYIEFNNGTRKCFDGKQRLTSLKRAIEGQSTKKYTPEETTQLKNARISATDLNEALFYDKDGKFQESLLIEHFHLVNSTGTKVIDQEFFKARHYDTDLFKAITHIDLKPVLNHFTINPSDQFFTRGFSWGLVLETAVCVKFLSNPKSLKKTIFKHGIDVDMHKWSAEEVLEIWNTATSEFQRLLRKECNLGKLTKDIYTPYLPILLGALYRTKRKGKHDYVKRIVIDFIQQRGAYEKVSDGLSGRGGMDLTRAMYTRLLQDFEILEERRDFPEKVQQTKLEQQKGRCALCSKPLSLDHAEADHKIPYAQGGPSTIENCQMVHPECHRIKGLNEVIPISHRESTQV